jgi:hypothetical protein
VLTQAKPPEVILAGDLTVVLAGQVQTQLPQIIPPDPSLGYGPTGHLWLQVDVQQVWIVKGKGFDAGKSVQRSQQHLTVFLPPWGILPGGIGWWQVHQRTGILCLISW